MASSAHLIVGTVALATVGVGLSESADPCDSANTQQTLQGPSPYIFDMPSVINPSLTLPDEDEQLKKSRKAGADKAKVSQGAVVSKRKIVPFDGFGQIAAEMEKASLARSANFLKKTGQFEKRFQEGEVSLSEDEETVAEAWAAVSAVIARAARPDLIEQVDTITRILQQLDQDLEAIRNKKGLTPATIALVELSILREKEALLASFGTDTLSDTETDVDKEDKSDTPKPDDNESDPSD